MKNKLVNILIFISITIFLIACTAEVTYKSCETSDDCGISELCSDKKICEDNYCVDPNTGKEVDACGKGKCVPEGNAGSHCEYLFTCDEVSALESFEDIEDCQIQTQNEAYYYLTNACNDYDKDLYDEYLACRDPLVCELNSDDCRNKLRAACEVSE